MNLADALPFDAPIGSSASSSTSIADQLSTELRAFRWHGKETQVHTTDALTREGKTIGVETFVNEFWTNRQRAAHSLHEIS